MLQEQTATERTREEGRVYALSRVCMICRGVSPEQKMSGNKYNNRNERIIRLIFLSEANVKNNDENRISNRLLEYWASINHRK